MILINKLADYNLQNTPVGLALGNFDGVHLGHQALIGQCIRECRKNGWEPCVLTFDPHPGLVLKGDPKIKLLHTTTQKLGVIESLGIKTVFLLRFDRQLSSTSPEDFIREYLLKSLPVKILFVGFNYTFGARGSGTPQLLQKMSGSLGFELRVIPPVNLDGRIVSSSLIREKISAGDISGAARFLGYWPFLEGPVIHGEERGRKLGFPTANLGFPDYQLLPGFGVYAAYVELEGRSFPAIVNIGVKPTFHGEKPTVEAHLFDYRENLYSQKIRIHLRKKIRSEIAFQNTSQLQLQIERDIQTARRLLKN